MFALNTTPLLYELERVQMYFGEPQWMFVNKLNKCPDPVASLYYQNHLIPKRNGHKSQESELRNLFYFYSWSQEINKPVSEVLLQGKIFSKTDLNIFSNWLRKRGTKVKVGDESEQPFKQIDGKFYRSIIYSTAEFLRWSADFFYRPSHLAQDSVELIEQKQVIKDEIDGWKSEKKNSVKRYQKDVDDLTDEEIIVIDKALNPNHRKDSSRAIVVRDYLIWRIALEFGVRKGEILCLEVLDMPEGQQEYLSVRRTEERGANYNDPRKDPPRVKTLSRYLPLLLPDAPYNADHTLKRDYEGTILGCSHVKHWWTEYVAFHRPYDVGHSYALCEHTDEECSPLGDLTSLVGYVKNAVGVSKFHPHICRHSLFNRLFLTKINSENYERDIEDIMYYGGWSSKKSVEIYTKRARKELAKGYAARFQASERGWELTKKFSSKARVKA